MATIFRVLRCCLAGPLLMALPALAIESTHSVKDSELRTRPGAPSRAVLDLGTAIALEALVPRLTDKRVVFVGESHDRMDHHLNQLAVIQGLHEAGIELAIGVEFFQQPFQAHLDAYVAGDLNESELLRRTEYFDRWGFDYRLYAPILRYAREQDIPVVALNVPEEITRKVAEGGLQGLNAEEARWVPDMEPAGSAYRARLKRIFEQHPPRKSADFERFVQVQLLWDEVMAQCAAEYLRIHPRRHMVILAGSGHLAFGHGIPQRLTRRLPVETAIVLNENESVLAPGVADFVILSEQVHLPPAGRLGLELEVGEAGLEVKALADGSAAGEAGVARGDRVLAIDGQPVPDMPALRAIMWNKRPGEQVALTVLQPGWMSGNKARDLQVTLR